MGKKEINLGKKKHAGRKINKKSIKGFIFGGIFGFIFSFLLYYIGDKLFPNGFGDSKLINSLSYFIYLLIFIMGYIVHIIIHEAGHLIFGLISGYKFVSFRIDSFTLIREKGRFKIKRYNIPGTAGQCLMMPAEMIDGKFPFLLYNLGGALLNLIVSVLGIYISIKLIYLPNIIRALLMFSGLGGILAGLTNAIPLKIGGIANDGYNILSMLRSEDARLGFYKQLRANGLLNQGLRIKDMALDDFLLSEDVDLSNPLNTSMLLLQHGWYLDNMDFEGAKACLDSLEPYMDKLVDLYKHEVNIEKIFLELIGENNKDYIDGLYSEDLKKHIKAGKFMISKKRFLMAYEGFYSGDRDRALEYHDEIMEMAEKYPVKGEADMEIMLAQYIRDRIKE